MEEINSPIPGKEQLLTSDEVRKQLGITTNDKRAFVIDLDGRVRLRTSRYPTIDSLRGVAGSLGRPLSWQQMQEIAYEDRFKAKDAAK